MGAPGSGQDMDCISQSRHTLLTIACLRNESKAGRDREWKHYERYDDFRRDAMRATGANFVGPHSKPAPPQGAGFSSNPAAVGGDGGGGK